MKFSGISFGGFGGGGTTIFSPHFKLRVYKNRKTKEFTTSIRKRRYYSLMLIFLFVSVPIDSFYLGLWVNTNTINNYANNTAQHLNVTQLNSLNKMIFIFEFASYFIMVLFIIFIYFAYFKGVRTWHGCEHKLIASAENNDVDNAKNYSRINDRCGGCYMLSAYSFLAVYWLFFTYVLHIPLPIGGLTLSFIFILLESKYFHKYNKPGIWCGRVLQKHITTSEPLDFQLQLGMKGMKELLEKEKEYEKENCGKIHFKKS